MYSGMSEDGSVASNIVATVKEQASQGCPVVTTSEISNALNVSRQTVHNHIDDALATEKISRGTIGNADVYWVAEDSHPPDSRAAPARVTDHPDFPGFYGEGWERRGHWRGLRSLIRTDIAEGSSPEHRALFLAEIFTTVNGAALPLAEEMAALAPGDYEGASDKSREDLLSMREPVMSSTEVEYYLVEKPLFSVPEYGAVEGLAEFCVTYQNDVAESLFQDNTLADLSDEGIEAWVPDCAAILETGDTLDEFLADAFQWKW